jgi:hypothetical protein
VSTARSDNNLASVRVVKAWIKAKGNIIGMNALAILQANAKSFRVIWNVNVQLNHSSWRWTTLDWNLKWNNL